MHNIRIAKVTEMMPAIEYLLNDGKVVRITVTGDSMRPFLRENIDSVDLSKTCFKDLHFGQIVLIKRNTGQIILHRVVKIKNDAFFIAGDAQNWIEGPLQPNQLLACVMNIWRKQKCINCSNWLLTTASYLWWLRFPIRYIPRKLKRFIIKVIKNNF